MSPSLQAICTADAPAPVGPYNQAVLAGGVLYCSGQIALDPASGALVGAGDVEAETRQVLTNLQAVLGAAGATPAQVVLAWGLQQGTAVIPKSVRAPRLASNLAASQLRLSATAMGQRASLERNDRLVSASMWTSPGSPYSQESLWG
jgi:aryl-alcohol dehydrogenase-like predicted oxidoreductase